MIHRLSPSPSLFSSASASDRSHAAPTAAPRAANPEQAAVADRFESRAGSPEQLIAGNPAGAVSALLMNVLVLGTGASGALSGPEALPLDGRKPLLPRELVLPKRGLGGI